MSYPPSGPTPDRHDAPRDATASSMPPGLVPVGISLSRRRVRLLDLRGADCREPDFRQTVLRWIAEHPEAAQLDLDLASVVAAARLESIPPPAGFLFNPPRCGSTLLANMLGAPAEHLVVKQSRTVNVLLREVLLASGEDERSAAEALLSLLLPLFSRADAETPRWLFFKPSSWAVNLIQPLDRLFPATPAVFLYRDPHQAVASMLASPPAHPPYVFPSEVPPATLHRFFPSLAAGPPALDAVSYYAHVWRSAAEAALDTLAESLHVVDYAALVADPEDVLAGILSHFTIPCRSATIQTMRDTLRVYSKDRDGRAAFDPDGTHHRTPLDPAQRRQVDAVVGDLPAYLTSRRR